METKAVESNPVREPVERDLWMGVAVCLSRMIPSSQSLPEEQPAQAETTSRPIRDIMAEYTKLWTAALTEPSDKQALERVENILKKGLEARPPTEVLAAGGQEDPLQNSLHEEIEKHKETASEFEKFKYEAGLELEIALGARDVYERENQRLQSRIESLKADMAKQLEVHVEPLKAKLNEAQSSCSKMSQEKHTLRRQAESLREELEKIRHGEVDEEEDFDKKQRRGTSHSFSKAAVRASQQKLQTNELNINLSPSGSQQGEGDFPSGLQKEDELKTLKETNKKLEADKEKLNSTISSLNVTIEALKRTQKDLETQYKSAMVELRHDLDDTIASLHQARADKSTLLDTIVFMEEDSSNREGDNKSTNQATSALESSNNKLLKLEREKEKIQMELTISQNNAKSLSSQLEELRLLHDAVCKDNPDAKVDGLKEILREKDEQIATLNYRINSLSENNKKKQTDSDETLGRMRARVAKLEEVVGNQAVHEEEDSSIDLKLPPAGTPPRSNSPTIIIPIGIPVPPMNKRFDKVNTLIPSSNSNKPLRLFSFQSNRSRSDCDIDQREFSELEEACDKLIKMAETKILDLEKLDQGQKATITLLQNDINTHSSRSKELEASNKALETQIAKLMEDIDKLRIEEEKSDIMPNLLSEDVGLIMSKREVASSLPKDWSLQGLDSERILGSQQAVKLTKEQEDENLKNLIKTAEERLTKIQEEHKKSAGDHPTLKILKINSKPSQESMLQLITDLIKEKKQIAEEYMLHTKDPKSGSSKKLITLFGEVCNLIPGAATLVQPCHDQHKHFTPLPPSPEQLVSLLEIIKAKYSKSAIFASSNNDHSMESFVAPEKTLNSLKQTLEDYHRVLTRDKGKDESIHIALGVVSELLKQIPKGPSSNEKSAVFNTANSGKRAANNKNPISKTFVLPSPIKEPVKASKSPTMKPKNELARSPKPSIVSKSYVSSNLRLSKSPSKLLPGNLTTMSSKLKSRSPMQDIKKSRDKAPLELHNQTIANIGDPPTPASMNSPSLHAMTYRKPLERVNLYLDCPTGHSQPRPTSKESSNLLPTGSKDSSSHRLESKESFKIREMAEALELLTKDLEVTKRGAKDAKKQVDEKSKLLSQKDDEIKLLKKMVKELAAVNHTLTLPGERKSSFHTISTQRTIKKQPEENKAEVHSTETQKCYAVPETLLKSMAALQGKIMEATTKTSSVNEEITSLLRDLGSLIDKIKSLPAEAHSKTSGTGLAFGIGKEEDELSKTIHDVRRAADAYCALDEIAVKIATSSTHKNDQSFFSKVKEFLKVSEAERTLSKAISLAKEEKSLRDKLVPIIKRTSDLAKRQLMELEKTLSERKDRLCKTCKISLEELNTFTA